MAMNLTDSRSNMHSEEQQNPEQVAKFNITFRLVCINDEAEGLCYFER